MKISVIGSGNVGSGLGRIFAEKGHEVFMSASTAEKASEISKTIGLDSQGGTVEDAVKFGDVIIVATPWEKTADVIRSAGSFEGKIIIDCTNPINPDMSGLAIGHSTSAAEEIAKIATGASVIKAFNTAFASLYQSPSRLFGSRSSTMFYCGDDKEAKATAKKLIFEAGFEAIDAGPLSSARYLEPMAMLLITLGYGQKMGTNIAFSLIRR
ncbi:MAG: NADPH-dependent F420 reductase [Nitrospirota bacterium]|nr:MAG: NADPH-dependent F420 reductase [Nitrospirota bacterium]